MATLRNVGGAMCGAVPTQIGLSRMGVWPDLRARAPGSTRGYLVEVPGASCGGTSEYQTVCIPKQRRTLPTSNVPMQGIASAIGVRSQLGLFLHKHIHAHRRHVVIVFT